MAGSQMHRREVISTFSFPSVELHTASRTSGSWIVAHTHVSFSSKRQAALVCFCAQTLLPPCRTMIVLYGPQSSWIEHLPRPGERTRESCIAPRSDTFQPTADSCKRLYGSLFLLDSCVPGVGIGWSVVFKVGPTSSKEIGMKGERVGMQWHSSFDVALGSRQARQGRATNRGTGHTLSPICLPLQTIDCNTPAT